MNDMNRPIRRSYHILKLTSCASIMLFWHSASADTAGQDETRDTDIIVVAKRAQSINSVAGGISVIGGDTLARYGLTQTDDLQQVLPGLTINTRGNRAYSNITIRGLSSPDYFSPAMQVYVDGAPQTPAAFTQPLIDVERVEYLRGPQGTLYGANALGGIVNIITRQPRENRAYVQTSLGTLEGAAEAAGTLALMPGAVFLDTSLYWQRGFGRIDDLSSGDRNIDTSRTLSGKLAVRYAPEEGDFDARISFSREHMHSHEELYLIDDRAGRLEYESADYGPVPTLERDLTSLSAQMNWQITDTVKLSGLTSWQDNDLGREFPGRVPGLLFAWPQREQSLTHELRLTHEGSGLLSGILGLWYADKSFTSWKNGYPGYYGASINQIDNRTFAGFADITLKPAAGVEFSVGGRISHDRTTIDASREDSFATGMGFSFQRKSTYDSFQPRIAASWKIANRLYIYGTMARGYKSGGYNHSISSLADADPYHPETAVNHELGLKVSGLFGGQLDLRLATYLIRSRDKQIYVGMIGQQTIRNAGKSESKGLEIETNWEPSDTLSFSGNIAFGHSRFTDFVDTDTGTSYTGNSVPYAPNVTARLWVGYTFPQVFLSGKLSLNTGVNHTSRTFFDEANSIGQGPITALDINAQLDLTADTTIRVFAANLTDEVVRTSGYTYDRTYWTVGTGRNIGVSIRQAF